MYDGGPWCQNSPWMYDGGRGAKTPPGCMTGGRGAETPPRCMTEISLSLQFFQIRMLTIILSNNFVIIVITLR